LGFTWGHRAEYSILQNPLLPDTGQGPEAEGGGCSGVMVVQLEKERKDKFSKKKSLQNTQEMAVKKRERETGGSSQEMTTET